MPYLRYIPGSATATKLASIRYPSKGSWTLEKCEEVFIQMCGYGRLEIVDEGYERQEKVGEKCDNEGTRKDGPGGALTPSRDLADASLKETSTDA